MAETKEYVMDKSPADVLEEAADLLLVHGRGRYQGHNNRTGEFCVMGAMAEAVEPRWWATGDRLAASSYWSICSHGPALGARNALSARLPLPHTAIDLWNDDEHTTDDDVRDTLLLAAKDLRNEAAT